MGLLGSHATAVDEAAHHVGVISRAFFVGEVANGDRPSRRCVGFFEAFNYFEGCENTEVAVVQTARADSIDVTTAHDRSIHATVAVWTNTNHVADRIDADLQTKVCHPGLHQVSAQAVFIGQRKACRTGLAR